MTPGRMLGYTAQILHIERLAAEIEEGVLS